MKEEEVEMKIRIRNEGERKIGAWTCANVIRRRKSYSVELRERDRKTINSNLNTSGRTMYFLDCYIIH